MSWGLHWHAMGLYRGMEMNISLGHSTTACCIHHNTARAFGDMKLVLHTCT